LSLYIYWMATWNGFCPLLARFVALVFIKSHSLTGLNLPAELVTDVNNTIVVIFMKLNQAFNVPMYYMHNFIYFSLLAFYNHI
jgi:hypothetical protein